MRELLDRLRVVETCLSSAVRAVSLGLHARDRAKGGLAEPPEVWFERAEASLRFALAELAYLEGPPPSRGWRSRRLRR